MKKIKSFLKERKEAFLMSLAMLFVSTRSFAQSARDIGGDLLSEGEDAFINIISDIVSFVQVVLVIGGIGMLVMVIFKIVKGDREAAEKFMYWLAGIVLGFALLSVMEGLVS